MPTIAMSIEGVLVDRSSLQFGITNCESSAAGRLLYAMAQTRSQVILLAEDHVRERVRAWLLRERLTKYLALYTWDPTSNLTPAEWRVRKLTELVGTAHQLTFVMDSDPAVVAAVLKMGVTGLLYAETSVFPGQESQTGQAHVPQPWDTIVQEIETQETLRAKWDEAARSEDDGEPDSRV